MSPGNYHSDFTEESEDEPGRRDSMSKIWLKQILRPGVPLFALQCTGMHPKHLLRIWMFIWTSDHRRVLIMFKERGMTVQSVSHSPNSELNDRGWDNRRSFLNFAGKSEGSLSSPCSSPRTPPYATVSPRFCSQVRFLVVPVQSNRTDICHMRLVWVNWLRCEWCELIDCDVFYPQPLLQGIPCCRECPAASLFHCCKLCAFWRVWVLYHDVAAVITKAYHRPCSFSCDIAWISQIGLACNFSKLR